MKPVLAVLLAVLAVVLLVYSFHGPRGGGGHGAVSRPRVLVVAAGVEPQGSTGSWAAANGSTRSYAVLLNTTRAVAGGSGYGAVAVWAWMLCPGGEARPGPLRLRVLDSSGVAVADTNVYLARRSIYCEALVLILAEPGSYTLTAVFPGGASASASFTVEPAGG